MSIAHELSSDIAEAVLARRRDDSSQSVRELATVVKEARSTLRRLDAEARRLRLRPRAAEAPEREAAATAE